MKKIAVLLMSLFTLASCEFDDSEIWDKLDEHEERIQSLEVLCRQMNTNIESLQSILAALQQNDYVTGVAPIMEGKIVIGYTITFSKSGSVTIYHGEDGQDGHTPKIGVKQDSDGIWYWTVDGDWSLDNYGNKVKAVGADGSDGIDGSDGADGVTPELKIESGYWYVSYDGGSTWIKLGEAVGADGADGSDGVDGSDGADGVTPELKIESGYWYVSYDGGSTWIKLGEAVGADGSDGVDGSDGADGVTPELKIESGYWYVSYDGGSTWIKLGEAVGADGADGSDGDAFFKDVLLSEEEVVFVLIDGTEIKVPMKTSLSMTLDTYNLVCSYCQTIKVGYSIVGPDSPLDLVVFSEGGYFTAIEEISANSGKVVIKTDMSSKDGKVIVMASCGGNTVVKTVSVMIDASASEDYIDEYGINHGAGVEIDGVIWAPVNCGYKSSTEESKGYPYGKLYQWGRKYGQGYSIEYDETEFLVKDGPVSLEVGQSDKYAHVYWSIITGDKNWLLSFDPGLWNSGTENYAIKSIYDPCPQNWRVPTELEMASLIVSHSDWTNENDKQGYLFYGMSNNNALFLPATGWISRTTEGGRDLNGAYWTSDVYVSLDFESTYVNMRDYALSDAYAIRCVREDSDLKFTVTGIELSEKAIELKEGQTLELHATLSPSSASGVVNWISDKPSVASVKDGIITAKSPGKAIISATIGPLSAQCEVTVIEKVTTGTEEGHEWVDLGLPSGVKWATCNVGASAPEGSGNYYSWAETSPKFDYSMGTYFMATNSPFGVTYNPFHVGDIAGTKYDAATENWGGKWQMPSRDDAQELIDNCTMEWTEKYGTYGYEFTGPNGNSIFLVAAGHRSSSQSAYGKGEYGNYWTSDCCKGNVGDAVYLYFQSNYTPRVREGSNYSKGGGRSVRAIIK